MINIFLVRHGDNDSVGNWLAGRDMSVHLNEQGRRQAQQTAEWLSTYPIQAIYSSPLSRAMETARPLAESLSLPIHEREALNEIDYGNFVGRTFTDLKNDPNWRQRVDNPATMAFPQGESIIQVQTRVTFLLDDLHNYYPENATIALFSHADTIRIFLAVALGLPLATYTRLDIAPASVSEISRWQDQYKVYFINQIPYGKFKIPVPEKS